MTKARILGGCGLGAAQLEDGLGAPRGQTRPRVPKALKEQRGSLNVTLENKHQPVAEPKLPDAPPDLTPAERAAWDKFAARVGAMRITTDDDFASLEMLAKLWV